MKKYPSKIRYGILFILLIVFGILGYYSFTTAGNTIFRVLYSLAVLFVLYLYFNRKYIIENGVLKIKTGLGIHPKIPISKITSIAPIGNRTDKFLGRDLLQITYNNHLDFLQINAPRKKKEFLGELLKINPSIQLKTQKSKAASVNEKN